MTTMYYVRILTQTSNKYQVQWIDGTVGWLKHPHKHMIQEWKQWQQHHPTESIRSEMNKEELLEEIAFIEQTTTLCNGPERKVMDKSFRPVINGFALWCDLCKCWYDKTCLVNRLFLPCIHSRHYYLKKWMQCGNLLQMQTVLEEKFDPNVSFAPKNVPTQLTLSSISKLIHKEWLDDNIVNTISYMTKRCFVIDSLLMAHVSSTNKLDRILTKVKDKYQNQPIVLIPFNIQNKHWVSFAIYQKKLWLFNSLPSFHVPAFHPQQIQLLQLFTTDLTIHPITLDRVQPDNDSCGAFVCAWFQRLSYGFVTRFVAPKDVWYDVMVRFVLDSMKME